LRISSRKADLTHNACYLPTLSTNEGRVPRANLRGDGPGTRADDGAEALAEHKQDPPEP
jgi:hypothetical protein